MAPMEAESQVRWSTNLLPFGPALDRYVQAGYNERLDVLDRVRAAARIRGLNGVELHYPLMFSELEPAKMREFLGELNLACSVVSPAMSGEPEWTQGSLSHPKASVREAAVARVKEGLDVARLMGANQINLWLGQDGHDYPFQADYRDIWGYLVESLTACARHAPDVRICLEPKPREPRVHCAVGTVGMLLHLIHAVGLPNLGGTLDIGHALMADENPAESAVLLASQNRLFHTHFNDSHGGWDWDLIVGSVHSGVFLELAFWLQELDYSGWYSLDQFPIRQDPVRACELSIHNMNALLALARKLDRIELLAALRQRDYLTVMTMMRQSFGLPA